MKLETVNTNILIENSINCGEISNHSGHYLVKRTRFHLFLQPPLLGHGQGRLSVLDDPVTVVTAIQKMKSHLGLAHLRLALGVGKTLGNIFLPLYFDLNVQSQNYSLYETHTFVITGYSNCYRFVKKLTETILGS